MIGESYLPQKGIKPFLFVFVFATLIAVLLSWGTYDINFWPTDSYYPYVPTAAKLFDLPYLSKMHDLPTGELTKINMRGKEVLILGIAIMQRLLKDTQSLFPNVLLLIIAVYISTILFYYIFRKLFDSSTGLLAAFLFSASFWPYMYVLQGAHQPLVLVNFLFSILFIQLSARNKFFFLAAGIFFGLMLFSSPTAMIYIPYFLITLMIQKAFKKFYINILLFLAGAAAVVLVFTYPDPIGNIRQFGRFVLASQYGNHFAFYHDYLLRHFSLPVSFRGAGWPWVIKYVFYIMPLMFTVYLISIIYLLAISRQFKTTLLIILISLSTPLAVETAQVAQFGRNYFSWLPGIIFVICYAFYYCKYRIITSLTLIRLKTRLQFSFVLLLLGHLFFNLTIFFGDIYPTSMGTTYIYRWLRSRGIEKVLVYQNHPRNLFVADVLNNPKTDKKIKFYSITDLTQATDGYVLVPPISGNTIFNDCSMDDYTDDPHLTALFDSGLLAHFMEARFRNIGFSHIWALEEEVCAYRSLMLHQITKLDRKKSYVYIFDAKRLQRAWTIPQVTNLLLPPGP